MDGKVLPRGLFGPVLVQAQFGLTRIALGS